MFNCQLSSITEEEGFEPPVRFPVQRFSRAKPSETPTNSPRLGPINIGVCGFCFGFDLGLFRWRTGTKPAHSNDGESSRIGSIYDDALYGQLRRVMPEMKW